ncbi:hypothetical protein [Thioalbus denitrificans]|uniref:Toxin CptA n=1 Tax=Thioalbus denitrificans TaxID=547122 RepID=A0A369CGQ0_9GAMM|nr:hypothetical protein [Thioalbus denitrificans]RCX31856.1 hypothetical protein DFQ59_102203 [Thioalbus denitrificans]
MSSGSEPCLRIEPRATAPERLYHLLTHGLALGAVMLSGAPAWSLVPVAPAVGWSLLRVWRRRVARRGRAALAAVSVDAGGRWWVEDGTGQRHEVVPTGPGLTGRWLVHARLRRRDGAHYTLLVTAGGAEEEMLRRLRRRLGAGTSAAAAEEP